MLTDQVAQYVNLEEPLLKFSKYKSIYIPQDTKTDVQKQRNNIQ